jgi:hypothetical protein
MLALDAAGRLAICLSVSLGIAANMADGLTSMIGTV